VSGKTKTHYSGALNQPIVRPLGLWGKQLLIREVEAKFNLLFRHYGIELSDRSRLQRLAICLALDHLPGMKVVDEQARKGAPQKWNVLQAKEFVELIDKIKNERGKGVEDAIRTAKKRGKLSGDTRALSNRYRLSKRQIKEHARWRDKLKDAPTLAEGVRRMLDVGLNKSSPKIK
jgi:hypothetical protein